MLVILQSLASVFFIFYGFFLIFSVSLHVHYYIIRNMRPAIPYSMDELLEFSELQERTKDAAEELESSFMKILEEHELETKEVLFTLARVADSFIRMHEDFTFDESKRIDAEAIFNDYFLACRDLQESQENDDEPVLDGQGN